MTTANAQGRSGDRAPNAITRRAAIQQVAAMLGSAALIGGDRLGAVAIDDAALAQAMAGGVGAFTAADVALLDDIAETILPETSTPGAKAAKTGAFMPTWRAFATSSLPARRATPATTNGRPGSVCKLSAPRRSRRTSSCRRWAPHGTRSSATWILSLGTGHSRPAR